MAKTNIIYLHQWSGDAHHAREVVAARFPAAEIRQIPHRRMRESTFRERIRLLRSFRGRAVVFYFHSLADLKYGLMMQGMHFLHRCPETVLCDGEGAWHSLRTGFILRARPGILFTLLRDVTTVAFWWLYLRLFLRRASPVTFDAGSGNAELAYLLPSPINIGASGGAISHIRGFLQGLKDSGRSCRVFTGTPLAQDVFANELIGMGNQGGYFFWQAALLAYNFGFAREVEQRLRAAAPGALYQRHKRFSIAGALLSRRMRIALIVEYNGPEVWIADHWDPSPFRTLIALCEQATLRCATRIVVVSEALQADLLHRGFAAERIRVNPNGVNGDFFSPGALRLSGRRALQVQPEDVLIGFVGSFSLWHGIPILQNAIVRLLSAAQPCHLRFLLIGDGLLHSEMRSALSSYEQSGQVIFTGSLPQAKVVEYLDASDILLSPHIPMPDGSRFFGSPTKLFEYMAMGKAIIASRLEQLAEVLTHDETGLLVTPGDVEELAQAIVRLALDPLKREALGSAARRIALKNHSWKQNVAIALEVTQVPVARYVPVPAHTSAMFRAPRKANSETQ